MMNKYRIKIYWMIKSQDSRTNVTREFLKSFSKYIVFENKILIELKGVGEA